MTPSATIRKRPPTVLVVGCGKAKIWDTKPCVGRVAAKDAYTSSLFRLCRRHAEKHHPHTWVILSAKHGILHPDTKIAKYDISLDTEAEETLRRRINTQWVKLFPRALKVKSLAGAAYTAMLRASIPQGVRVEVPLQSMGLFHRLAWLKHKV